jgi:hypothetical protein
MVTLISAASVAKRTRARSGLGASLPLHLGLAVRRDRAQEMATARTAAAAPAVTCLRPQTLSGAALFGKNASPASEAKFASPQPTSQQYAHKTTRIAATGGGAMGPHPARDPV